MRHWWGHRWGRPLRKAAGVVTRMQECSSDSPHRSCLGPPGNGGRLPRGVWAQGEEAARRPGYTRAVGREAGLRSNRLGSRAERQVEGAPRPLSERKHSFLQPLELLPVDALIFPASVPENCARPEPALTPSQPLTRLTGQPTATHWWMPGGQALALRQGNPAAIPAAELPAGLPFALPSPAGLPAPLPLSRNTEHSSTPPSC